MDHQKRYRPQVRHVKRRREREQQQPGESAGSTNSESSWCAIRADDSRKPLRGQYINGTRDDDSGEDEWPPLPAYAHHLILDRLPARQRSQVRCVCKAWNYMPPLRMAPVSPLQELWFVMVRPSKHGHSSRRSTYFSKNCFSKNADVTWRFRAYSSRSLYMKDEGDDQGFFRPPLPNPQHSKLSSLLGTGPNCSRVARKLKCMHFVPLYVRSLYLRSAGGLMSAIVCRPGAAEDCYDLIVFNCLTGCVKVLPPPLNSGQLSMLGSSLLAGSLHMTLDGQDPSCYYILLSDYRAPEYFEVFDSSCTRWKAVCNPYVPFKSGQLLHDFVATHSSAELSVADADFWWLVSVTYGQDEKEDEDEESDEHWPEDSERCLLGYYARHDAWTGLLLPSIPYKTDSVGNKILTRYKSRLLLGHRLLGADGAILGFAVSELQLTSMEAGTWVEVARTPEHLCPPSTSWIGHLSADRGVFWMTFYHEDNYRSFRPPLVFDMAQNSWYSLPLTRSSRKFGCLFVHRPSFSARV